MLKKIYKQRLLYFKMNKRLISGVLVFSLVLLLSFGVVSALDMPAWLQDALGLDRGVSYSPDGLELHLEFEGNLVDSSGNGRGGTCPAGRCPTFNNAGKFGNAALFNEIDEYVEIADFDYGSDGEFTISFWFNQNLNGGVKYQYMFSHGEFAKPNGVNIYKAESGVKDYANDLLTVVFDYNDAKFNSIFINDLGQGEWYLYTLVVDGNGRKVYINGELAGSTAHGGEPINPESSIVIGGRSVDFSSERFYNGMIDDLKIFSKPLGAQEVEDLFEGDSVGNTDCQDLFGLVNSKLGSACGDANYDKVADVDNDGDVDSIDNVMVVNRQTDLVWCGERLEDQTDPCVVAECVIDSDCDDGVSCTLDTCDLGSCNNVAKNNLCGAGQSCDSVLGCVDLPECAVNGDCDDGLFCNGLESCNTGTEKCEAGANPCSVGELCDEVNDICVQADQITCEEGQIIGDVDGDGDVDSEDADLVTQIVTNILYQPEDVCCVDVSQNGDVSGLDATYILQIEEGSRQSPGVCESFAGCDSGCSVGEECVPIGFRWEDSGVDRYCATGGSFSLQKVDGESCQNDFECVNNQCSKRECVELVGEIREQAGMLAKIWCWLTNMADSSGYDQCLIDGN